MRNRFRAGDTTALGEAYDEHAQVLFRYAMRVCGHQAAAEDVVSATFLEAWRCRERLRPDGDGLRPWLLGIATNILRSTARETRRRDTALARLADRGVLPDFAEDVVARLYDTEQLDAARAALKRLRRRDREVFALVVWAGLDYAAAGEALGIPVGTVRSRLSRARDRLRTLAEAELKAVRTARRAASGDGVKAVRPGSAAAVTAGAAFAPAAAAADGGDSGGEGTSAKEDASVRDGALATEGDSGGEGASVRGRAPARTSLTEGSGPAAPPRVTPTWPGPQAPATAPATDPRSARTVLAAPRPIRAATAATAPVPASTPLVDPALTPKPTPTPTPAPALARRSASENSL